MYSSFESVGGYFGYNQTEARFIDLPLPNLQYEQVNGISENYDYQKDNINGIFREPVIDIDLSKISLGEDTFFDSLQCVDSHNPKPNPKIFDFGSMKTPDSPPPMDIPPPPFPKKIKTEKKSSNRIYNNRSWKPRQYQPMNKLPSYYIPVPRRSSPDPNVQFSNPSVDCFPMQTVTSTEEPISLQYFSESVVDEDFYDDDEEENEGEEESKPFRVPERRITRQSSKKNKSSFMSIEHQTKRRRKKKKNRRKKKKKSSSPPPPPRTLSSKKYINNRGSNVSSKNRNHRTGRKRKRKNNSSPDSNYNSYESKKSSKRRKRVVQRRFHSQEPMIERFFEQQNLGWRKMRTDKDDDQMSVILKSFKSGTSLNEAITSVGDQDLETIILKGGRRGRSPKTYVNSCSGELISQFIENNNGSSSSSSSSSISDLDEQISLELHYAHYIGDLDEVNFRKCDEVNSPIKYEMDIRRIRKSEDGNGMEIHYQINVEKKIRKVLLLAVFYMDDYENGVQYGFGSIFVKETGWQRENEDEVLEVVLVPFEREL